ncbi:hypothetical protein O181_074010 [Austropuccinia psidii MF-1]|uniref:Uncharacterized protein n=1 Tax=Austropuccinia psidii MF-1 TaxID=1389203 RepID=A0A9Q3ICL2_9BASI|nr:hypothetical protein [Austropuccinia psidii MF-1]
MPTSVAILFLLQRALRSQLYLSPDNIIEEIELEKFEKSLQSMYKKIENKRAKIIGKLKANQTTPQEEELLNNHGRLIEESVIFKLFVNSNNDGKDIIELSCMEFEATKHLVEHWNDIQSSNVNFNQIYNVYKLSAMHLSLLAWNSINQATISNFWDHTKIIPKFSPIPNDFGVAIAENSLTEEGNHSKDLGLIRRHR